MPGNVTLRTRKIVILGSRSVGKSSLVKQFVDNNFSDSYYPNTDTKSTKTIAYNGVDYPCELIDTAGQDEFSQLNSQHAIGIHGYVLVYSITSRASFEMVQIIYDKILNYCGVPSVPAIIVGSKADLHTSRQVDSADGERLARENNTAWIETSALRNENVGKVFELCLAEIEKGNAPPPPPNHLRKGSCYVM
ncbi:P-loop containing nucleoside triphosphate hydrolase protein [Mycena rebaudengoi]|nr:P-loop containing nucleoside triphosphate hydrolase protein [Mycena rebaudengoi]KAJ7275635.1 P-loop containing nucleoside triphosphate hydrolase protein [Mycena rebaudengoi]